MKSFAETKIGDDKKVYMKAEILHVLDAEIGDVLLWYINNGEVVVRKKEGGERTK